MNDMGISITGFRFDQQSNEFYPQLMSLMPSSIRSFSAMSSGSSQTRQIPPGTMVHHLIAVRKISCIWKV